MAPLISSTKDTNRLSTGFVLANNQPCKISEKARRKALEAATELFNFGNIDVVDELISVKRKAYTDPKKSAKKKKLLTPKIDDDWSDWDEDGNDYTNDDSKVERGDDDDIEWSDCEADLSRTVLELDKSIRDKSTEENQSS